MPWRKIQRTNIRNVLELANFLELDPTVFSQNPRFPLNLPRRLANKMAKKTLTDPLVRQFAPLPEENLSPPGYHTDPVQDISFCKAKKLLQKYEGRALLLTNSACAMHCRYCFRQNFDYAPNLSYSEEITLLQKDPSIKEVILSGGDPLSLSDRVLKELLDALSSITHIQIIRFHTRFPIGIPERIDPSFLNLLKNCPKQIIFLIHANHQSEFDSEVFASLKEVQKLGIPVLLQSILLKGINDDFPTLKRLFEECAFNGIIPYYLHQLDKVSGAAHFDVPIQRGKALIEELRASLPGYAIPRYVQEIPGETSKTVI